MRASRGTHALLLAAGMPAPLSGWVQVQELLFPCRQCGAFGDGRHVSKQQEAIGTTNQVTNAMRILLKSWK
jgi:hypothetical protein